MRKIIISLADRVSGFTPHAILTELHDTEAWDSEQLNELQLKYLRRLIAHAAAHVPHYRDMFRRARFSVEAIRDLSDIRMLPVITKAEIMACPERFISDLAPRPFRYLRTSGSTGVPFRFVLTPLAQSYKIASRIRFRQWYDVERCDAQLIVGGLPATHATFISRIHDGLHDFAANRYVVCSSELHERGLQRAARLVLEKKVKSIRGYPTAIAELADHFREAGVKHELRGIFTNSETLTSGLRRRIRAGFGIEPRSEYVATEGSLAFECPQGAHHVPVEETLMETHAAEDGMCHVVATFLHTLDFPLIRYRIGDLVAPLAGQCSCGRRSLALREVLGRYADAITMPDGRLYSAASINMRIAHLPYAEAVSQYQIIQTSPDAVDLCVVTQDPEVVAKLAAELGVLLAPIRIVPCHVASVSREGNGKFRPVIGMCDPLRSSAE